MLYKHFSTLLKKKKGVQKAVTKMQAKPCKGKRYSQFSKG